MTPPSEPNAHLPHAGLPKVSLRRLNSALLVAAGAAALVTVTMVMPAEYGIDLTGVGRVLGLTEMGEMKAAQSGQAAPSGPIAEDAVTTDPDGSRRVRIVIGPYGGREVKAYMKAGADMTFKWTTDGQPVEFEFHGDPDNPTKPGEYSSYAKGKSAGADGAFKAAFTGRHGWFWKNLSVQPVVITAVVKGTVDKFEPLYEEGESAASTAATASGGLATSDGTPYYTSLPMKEFMSGVMSHSANEIWKRQGYVSDENGLRSLFPKNDEEWKEAENGALALAELSNVLLIPGRRVDQPAWTEGVIKVRQSALQLAALARKKNNDAYMEAGVALNEACYSCHKTYAPGVD